MEDKDLNQNITPEAEAKTEATTEQMAQAAAPTAEELEYKEPPQDNPQKQHNVDVGDLNTQYLNSLAEEKINQLQSEVRLYKKYIGFSIGFVAAGVLCFAFATLSSSSLSDDNFAPSSGNFPETETAAELKPRAFSMEEPLTAVRNGNNDNRQFSLLITPFDEELITTIAFTPYRSSQQLKDLIADLNNATDKGKEFTETLLMLKLLSDDDIEQMFKSLQKEQITKGASLSPQQVKDKFATRKNIVEGFILARKAKYDYVDCKPVSAFVLATKPAVNNIECQQETQATGE